MAITRMSVVPVRLDISHNLLRIHFANEMPFTVTKTGTKLLGCSTEVAHGCRIVKVLRA